MVETALVAIIFFMVFVTLYITCRKLLMIPAIGLTICKSCCTGTPLIVALIESSEYTIGVMKNQPKINTDMISCTSRNHTLSVASST